MKISLVDISKINPAPYNPRLDLQPGDPDYEKLSRSISEFDCVEPLVWNRRTGNLVGGHQRLKVLIAQGRKQVPCSIVNLPPEKEKTLNLALNRISGDWDKDKLAVLLDELVQLPDFDLELTGFDIPEASHLIDDIIKERDVREDNFDFNAELARISRPKTKLGEVLELGQHRLICGDSTKSQDVEKLLGGRNPGMILTDSGAWTMMKPGITDIASGLMA